MLEYPRTPQITITLVTHPGGENHELVNNHPNHELVSTSESSLLLYLVGQLRVQNNTRRVLGPRTPDRKCPRGGYRLYRVSVDTKHHTHTTYLKWRPHFWVQKQIYHNSDCFVGGSLHEVVDLGSEFIGL